MKSFRFVPVALALAIVHITPSIAATAPNVAAGTAAAGSGNAEKPIVVAQRRGATRVRTGRAFLRGRAIRGRAFRRGATFRRGRVFRGRRVVLGRGLRPRNYRIRPYRTYRGRIVRRGGRIAYPRVRYRRPGYRYFYRGWWYPFAWWPIAAPVIYATPRVYRGGRCSYWARRCARTWGYGNANFYGCMRYHRCR